MSFRVNLLIPIIIFLTSAISLSNETQIKYRVIVNNMIVRSEPSINSKQLEKLQKDSVVYLLEITDKEETVNMISAKWYKIKLKNGVIGYVFSGFIELMPEKNIETIKADYINIDVIYYLIFDTKYISKEELNNCLILYPDRFESYGHPISMIETCNEDKEYSKCGSRDINDPNFFINAEVNLQKARKIIDELNAIQYCKDLEPLINYYKELKQYEYWMEKTQFDYYKQWDINILKQKYKKINPVVCAASSIKKIENASDITTKYNLTWHAWSNDINHYLRTYVLVDNKPKILWDNFIRNKHIQEKFEITIRP